MEIFGGFMVMLSIIGFFLTVIWFILPFVIFSIKGKVDRTLILVEESERRLVALEELLKEKVHPPEKAETATTTSPLPTSTTDSPVTGE